MYQPRPFDWPQWRGPERNAISRETGLLQTWPTGGPPLAWKVEGLGGGYTTPSVAAGRVFGMSYRGTNEVVWALDEANGRELWSTVLGKRAETVNKNEGPRCTPTVDGDVLYALGVSGDLVCLETATGKERWRRSLPKDFGGEMMSNWGYSESPLVDGDRLICTPGGKGATLVALDKRTGKEIWRAAVPQDDPAGYASAVAADVAGRRQYIQFVGGGVVGVAADDGKFLWRYDAPACRLANCSSPLYHEGHVFAASAYNRGGGLARLTRDGDAFKAEEVYLNKKMQNQHGGMVLVDGYLYGANGGNGPARLFALVCLEFKTGKVMWEEKRAGKGSISYADGRLYYRNENGPMLLLESNPSAYVECGRFTQPDVSKVGRVWPHPVIANGRLYLRDQGLLLCYDVKRH
jgi:outer membrane protein assembly factor BamB